MKELVKAVYNDEYNFCQGIRDGGSWLIPSPSNQCRNDDFHSVGA